MRYAYIENNVVINTILWDGIAEYNPGESITLIQSDKAQIGDRYEDGKFIYQNTIISNSEIIDN